ncbi:hypothetical protein HK098_000469 [Nowakowskiella sp. JEL0407]|nr:hypothetical protein HK098_000469 [Nowakowskiella sp. JEL0407]
MAAIDEEYEEVEIVTVKTTRKRGRPALNKASVSNLPDDEEEAPVSTKKLSGKITTPPATKEAEKLRSRMAKKLITAIKKTAHSSRQSKPYTMISETTSEEIARLVMEASGSNHSQISRPVNPKGFKVWAMAGQTPKLYIRATFDSLEISFAKSARF